MSIMDGAIHIDVRILMPDREVRSLARGIPVREVYELQIGPAPLDTDIAGRKFFNYQRDRAECLARAVGEEIATCIADEIAHRLITVIGADERSPNRAEPAIEDERLTIATLIVERCRNEGAEAFHAGKSRGECPYAASERLERAGWEDGFSRAGPVAPISWPGA